MDQKTFEFLRQHSVNFLTMALDNERQEKITASRWLWKVQPAMRRYSGNIPDGAKRQDRFGLLLHKRLYLYGRMR